MRRPALWALQLLLTLAVTWFILDRVGLGLEELAALDAADWRPRTGLLLLSCGLLFGGYAASAWIWSLIAAELGGPRLPLRVAVDVYLVANLGRYVPGKLWQIAGLAVLALGRGVPAAVSTAAAVLGQAVALGGAALVGAAALGSAEAGAWTLLFLAVLAALLAVALVPALQRRAVGLWFRLARHREPPVRASAAAAPRWLVLYALNWILYSLAFVVLVRSFGLPGSAVALGSAFAAAYVLGYAALFAPAGIGVREGFLVLFLAPVMGAGPAGAVSVIARLWTTGVEVVPAAAFWGLHLSRTARRAPEGQGKESGEAEAPRPPGRP